LEGENLVISFKDKKKMWYQFHCSKRRTKR
jgi:hypothetical protein